MSWLATRVVRVLGSDPDRTAELLGNTRVRLGATQYWSRSALFVIATARAGGILPAGVRWRGIRGLTGQVLNRPGDAMYFLGETDVLAADGCGGLIRE